MSFTSIATLASLPLAVQGIRSLESVGDHLIDTVSEGASFLRNLAADSTTTESAVSKPTDAAQVSDPVAAIVDKLKSLFRENGIEGPFELMARTGADSELSIDVAGVDAAKVRQSLAQRPELIDEVGKLVNSLSAATGGTFQAIFRMTEQGGEISYGA